jgi:hypothetical protein
MCDVGVNRIREGGLRGQMCWALLAAERSDQGGFGLWSTSGDRGPVALGEHLINANVLYMSSLTFLSHLCNCANKHILGASILPLPRFIVGYNVNWHPTLNSTLERSATYLP